MYYTTLSTVKSYLNLTETSDDALLTRWIRYASGFIEKWKERRYDIRQETLLFDTPLVDNPAPTYLDIINGQTGKSISQSLRLNEDLLEVVEVTNGDGDVVASGDYVLESARYWPKSRIVMKNAGDTRWTLDDDGNYRQVISVEGIWGFASQSDYFIDSADEVEDAPLAAGTTTMLVNNTAGVASDLLSPRFEAGQIIKMEDEFCYILEVTDATHLEVIRGYNGTTAAEHAQNTQIDVFRPDDDIAQVCLRLVAWRYRQKDADVFDKVYDFGSKAVTIPTALPADVREILGKRGRPRIQLQ